MGGGGKTWIKTFFSAGRRWLTPVILATLLRRQRSGGSLFKASLGRVRETLSQKYSTQNGRWSGSSGRASASKCESLSSNPSPPKKSKAFFSR
jgi:hypothetical protein